MFDYLNIKERFWGTADCYELFSNWERVMKGVSLDDIMQDILFDEDLLVEEYGLMEKEKIQQFYQEFLTDEKIWYKEVFNIISIEIWLRTYHEHLISAQKDDNV